MSAALLIAGYTVAVGVLLRARAVLRERRWHWFVALEIATATVAAGYAAAGVALGVVLNAGQRRSVRRRLVVHSSQTVTQPGAAGYPNPHPSFDALGKPTDEPRDHPYCRPSDELRGKAVSDTLTPADGRRVRLAPVGAPESHGCFGSPRPEIERGSRRPFTPRPTG